MHVSRQRFYACTKLGYITLFLGMQCRYLEDVVQYVHMYKPIAIPTLNTRDYYRICMLVTFDRNENVYPIIL